MTSPPTPRLSRAGDTALDASTFDASRLSERALAVLAYAIQRPDQRFALLAVLLEKRAAIPRRAQHAAMQALRRGALALCRRGILQHVGGQCVAQWMLPRARLESAARLFARAIYG